MNAREMTTGDIRNEVHRARKILKRLSEATDKEKAAEAISEIAIEATLRFSEVKE